MPVGSCLIFCQTMSSLEQVLKAYEGPDQFFLHNINAISCKSSWGNLLMRSSSLLKQYAAARRTVANRQVLVEPDGVEPTTSCLQSRRSTN